MTWTTPRTWVTGEIVIASHMNTHIRDNSLYLGQLVEGTRRMPMALVAATVYQFGWSDPGWRDNETDDVRFGGLVPGDWVAGTDITVHALLLQSVTGGSPIAVLRSYLSCQQDQDLSSWNIENAVNMNAALTSTLLEEQVRTIPNADIAAGDGILWQIQRLGSDGSDAVVGSVSAMMTAWVEYTALF